MTTAITPELAAKVLAIVDAGLTNGIGDPEPGRMCVEAAVCYALGQPHGDNPSCVAPTLRSLNIRLSDSSWSSNKARANGLRRLALAQLGSVGHLDEKEFVGRVVKHALTKSVPLALRAAASVHEDVGHKGALLHAAARCERDASPEAVREARKIATAAAATAAAAAYADAAAAAAYAAAATAATAYAATAYAATAAAAATVYAATAYAATAKKAARDEVLSDYAEEVVQILVEMKAPGCQFLNLAPLGAEAALS